MTIKLKKEERESTIQGAVCKYLEDKGYLFWRANNIPAISYGPSGPRMRKLPKWTPRGLPDINMVYKGQYIGIEVKSFGNWLNEAQKYMALKIKEAGGKFICVKSIDELKDSLDNIGIPQ